MDKDNLSSLSECAEYGKGFRVPKRKIPYDNKDTDTESDECSEEELSIDFPTYKADKTVISSNSAHKSTVNQVKIIIKNFDVIFLKSLFFSESVTKAYINKSNNVCQFGESNKKQNSNILAEIHTNKSNNNVYQISESTKQNSDKILVEIHTNFEKHAIEMKGNMYGEKMFQNILLYIFSNSLAIRKIS